MDRYAGKNAVIVGGSSGIGLATAKLLVDEGARVLITGRTRATLDAAREKLGDNALAVRGDISSRQDIDALADRVSAEFGAIDALFVSAAVPGFAPFESTSEQTYDELFAVNAKGPYFTVQKLVPLLGEGSGVVLATSAASVLGVPTLSAYAATKAALRSMTRTLARELLPRKVRVNAVSPSTIDTGILERSLPGEAVEQARAQWIEASPMRRIGDPLEVAKVVAFLAFEATFTTGAEVPVDGGSSQL